MDSASLDQSGEYSITVKQPPEMALDLALSDADSLSFQDSKCSEE